MLRTCSGVEHRNLESPGPVDDSQKVSSPTMSLSVSRSVVRRVLSVATALTLVGFAASMDLQPAGAIASLGASADLAAGVSYLADDNNDNHDDRNNNDEHRNNNDENRNNNDNHNNNDENRNNDENENHENNEHNDTGGNTSGQGIFSTICSVPGFANNAGCSAGLFGS
jgi:hypothetical protein